MAVAGQRRRSGCAAVAIARRAAVVAAVASFALVAAVASQPLRLRHYSGPASGDSGVATAWRHNGNGNGTAAAQ